MAEFHINERVRLLKAIIEYPDGDSPGGCCGNAGDIVLIRKIRDTDNAEWPYSVSHEDRTDGNTFSVAANEIERATKEAK